MSSSLPVPSVPTYGGTGYPAIPNNGQIVIPQITIPQNLQASVTPQSISSVSPQASEPQFAAYRIKGGMDSAKAFQTVPNMIYALFEEDDDVFYMKVTDKNNYPIELKRFVFHEEDEPIPEPPPEPATKQEYEELLKEVQGLREEIKEMHSVKEKPDDDALYSILEDVEKLKKEIKMMKGDAINAK